jgi:hypothetical protein
MITMADAAVNADTVKENETIVYKESNFAAVPIHFRPKQGAQPKLLKFVIPGIEPPLFFAEVSGDSPDTIKFQEVDGPTTSVSKANEDEIDIKVSDQTDDNAEGTLDEESAQADDASEEKVDENLLELDADMEEAEAINAELSYPYDDDGRPVAGFLLGTEEDPTVVTVYPKDGQTAEQAMEEASKQNPKLKPGTLQEAEKLLGHSPFTSEDN